jgi:hypothetical protein
MSILLGKLLLLAMLGQAEPLTADAIMAKVAANQDLADKLRSEYTYKQHVHIVTRKTNKNVMREEASDYDVLPAPEGTKKTLRCLTGRYWHKGKYIEFRGEPVPDADSVDGSLVHNLREDLSSDKSKDGLARDLFPLTTEEQSNYQFTLAGQDTMKGRDVYRIEFKPKNKDEVEWAGEAFIDMAEFQPLYVRTNLSHRIPFFVRAVLGTDLPGIGFSVDYQRQPDGVWFPVSFGTEFRLRALLFVNRNISVSLHNTAFKHANSQSAMPQP